PAMCQPAGALTTIWPKRKRRYHHLVRLQRYTGRLCEERNNFVGRPLRDSVESLNTWREGRAYVRGRWEEVPHTMISTATKPQSIFPPRSFIAPIVTRNDSYQRLDLCRRCLRGIEFLSRPSSTWARSGGTTPPPPQCRSEERRV